MKKWLIRIGLMLLGPMIALLLVELIWQLIGDPRFADNEAKLKALAPHWSLGHRGVLRTDPDPEIAFALQPGFDETLAGNRYRINQHGMRGADVTLHKPAGTKRVVVLGDSYAFGFGVAEDATISAQLQHRLNGKHPGVQVLNMGVPGYQTGQQARVLERDGLRFDPDLVVLVYFANDNMAVTFLYDPRVKVIYVDELPLPLGLKKFMARSILYSKITKAYTAWLTDTGELNACGPRQWPITEQRLRRIADRCRASKIPLVIVAIPALDNSIDFINMKHVYNQDHDRLLAFAAEHEIPRSDVRAVLLKRAPKPIEDLFVSRTKPVDGHLNAEGYRLLVADLVRCIEAEELLK